MPKNRNVCPCTRCTVNAYDGMMGNCRLCNTKGRPDSSVSMMKLSRGSTTSTPEFIRTTMLLEPTFTSVTSAPLTHPRLGSKLRVIMYLKAQVLYGYHTHTHTHTLINECRLQLFSWLYCLNAGSLPGTDFTLQYSWWRSWDVQTLHEFIAV